MSHPPLIFGPIPPYNNPPIEPQFFQPSQFFISNISLGQTTTVTTTINHNYVLGQQVRLLIPVAFGSRGLNEQTGFVIAIPAANEVTLDTISVGIDPFINASFSTKAQIVAIGDYNTGLISSSGRNLPTTAIPGTFINIS